MFVIVSFGCPSRWPWLGLLWTGLWNYMSSPFQVKNLWKCSGNTFSHQIHPRHCNNHVVCFGCPKLSNPCLFLRFQEISCLIPSKWGSSCKSPRETTFLSKSTRSTLWKTCLFQTGFMKQHAWWSVQISHLLSCHCYASNCVFWVPPAQTQLNREVSRDHMPI